MQPTIHHGVVIGPAAEVAAVLGSTKTCLVSGGRVRLWGYAPTDAALWRLQNIDFVIVIGDEPPVAAIPHILNFSRTRTCVNCGKRTPRVLHFKTRPPHDEPWKCVCEGT